MKKMRKDLNKECINQRKSIYMRVLKNLGFYKTVNKTVLSSYSSSWVWDELKSKTCFQGQ